MSEDCEACSDLADHIPWYDAARFEFAQAETLSAASKSVWGRGWHRTYQHYTTLSSVVTKILERKWWLSRSDSDTLNDRQESAKFGDRELLGRTYQASFVHGAAESAALWGLYQPSNPFAIRITLPGQAVQNWVKSLGEEKQIFGESLKAHKVDEVGFKDIIYAAVDFRGRKWERGDIKRSNGLYWSEVNSKDVDGLEDEIGQKDYTGWLKDYEWRHERESRLCVRTLKTCPGKAMWVRIDDALLSAMKFTFSPWLPSGCQDAVKGVLETALKNANVDLSKCKIQRFRKSVLQGGLNFRGTQYDQSSLETVLRAKGSAVV